MRARGFGCPQNIQLIKNGVGKNVQKYVANGEGDDVQAKSARPLRVNQAKRQGKAFQAEGSVCAKQ